MPESPCRRAVTVNSGQYYKSGLFESLRQPASAGEEVDARWAVDVSLSALVVAILPVLAFQALISLGLGKSILAGHTPKASRRYAQGHGGATNFAGPLDRIRSRLTSFVLCFCATCVSNGFCR